MLQKNIFVPSTFENHLTIEAKKFKHFHDFSKFHDKCS